MECPSISNSNEKQKPVDKKIDPQLIRKGDSGWKDKLVEILHLLCGLAKGDISTG
jgi:hypothetical protein